MERETQVAPRRKKENWRRERGPNQKSSWSMVSVNRDSGSLLGGVSLEGSAGMVIRVTN